ncbi:RES family NAD+ phosphorylase [Emcibacter sp. SYSU 3D8]|uniref:RES family NAD+ phosphorylase n=1 Tax=Emcibacter sp. SYSU 3D8 TaxID=3133969 RepID=UPI0031FEF47D
MRLPPTTAIRQNDTHRLIPSRYSDGGDSVLARIADSDVHLQDIFDLDHATNDRLQAENDRLPGIGIRELVFSVPNYRIVNAAFCHPHPLGSRFNGPERGAWYAAFDLATAQDEIVFHKGLELAEIGGWRETVTYDDYLADFGGTYHDLRGADDHADCLAPESYLASQALAEVLLESGAPGIIYPSVRRRRGTCIACFRPAMVANVRKAERWSFAWDGAGAVTVTEQRPG